ncbi:S-adenosylmethionine uptake transporter [Alteromonadaceae bacterium 2753L.S.0a.02]|nr:S-adenosylmethionine uptake transporter [Alteromonadaceae bacterium 2753L.S.0a.02]
MLVACLCFSIMAVCVRKIGTQLPLSEIAFFRSIIPTLIVSLLIFSRRQAFFPKPRKPLLLRGLLGTGGLLCFFHATQHLPLSVSGILVWCTPLVTYITARVVLKETLTLQTLGWLVLAIIGLQLIFVPVWQQDHSAQGALRDFKLIDFAIGLLGTLFAGLVFVTIRSASASHNNNSIVLSFSLAAAIITGAMMLFDYQRPSLDLLLLLILMGIAGTLAQIALTEAYRNAPAALVSSMSLMQAPFTISLGVIFFSEILSAYHVVGVIVMGIGVVFASISHSRLRL